MDVQKSDRDTRLSVMDNRTKLKPLRDHEVIVWFYAFLYELFCASATCCLSLSSDRSAFTPTELRAPKKI